MGSIEAVGHSRQIAGTVPLIELRGIGKSYQTPAGEFPVLSEINLEIITGEFVAITGKSGLSLIHI